MPGRATLLMHLKCSAIGEDRMHLEEGTLQAFADELERDLHKGLSPGVQRADQTVFTGVHLGVQTISDELAASAKVLRIALAQAESNTGNMVQAAQILVAAARKVLENYQSADLASSVELAAVDKTLRDAAAQARQALAHVSVSAYTGGHVA